MRQEREAKVFRYAVFHISALCHLASKLRGGQACFCDSSQSPVSGSLNWTIVVSFRDGVEWILRSPREDGAIQSAETNMELLSSEAATLRYIRSKTGIPVPEVFAYSATWDNEIGIPFILMSKAPGFPLQRAWKMSDTREALLTQNQKSKIVSQLGNITWRLSQLRINKIGSIFEENGEFRVKSCLSRGLLMNERYLLEELPRGPFISENEYYAALISAFLGQAKHLPLGHHCLFAPVPSPTEYKDKVAYRAAIDRWNDFVTTGSKIDGADNRMDYVLAGDILLDLLTEWRGKCSNVSMSDSPDTFPLSHPDLSVNNIFIDHEYNITCIIDWAFCTSVPLPELLTLPGLPQSRNEIEQSLIPTFEDGFRQAALKGQGQPSPEQADAHCQLLRHSRPTWLCSRLLNFDSTKDYSLLQGVWNSTRPQDQRFPAIFRSNRLSKQHLILHSALKEGDMSAEQVALAEMKYFGKDIRGLAVARKLDMVSQWSTRYKDSTAEGIRAKSGVFIADKRLWQWIEKSLEYHH